MLFPQPLTRARLIRRYKRFLADVELDGGEVTTIHTPNPGAMMGLDAPGSTVWCSRSDAPTRKLPLTFELIEADGGLVGVNTLHPNRLVREALLARTLAPFADYGVVRSEVVVDAGSRLDFVLEGEGLPRLLLEVKNCHLRRTGALAEFPDCAAKRSAKHARLLAERAKGGERCAIVFVVQRSDCDAFAPAADLDPDFAAALETAHEAGVRVYAFGCRLDVRGIELAGAMPVIRVNKR